jgi:hypothetical protein
MTTFTKHNLTQHNGYVTYQPEEGRSKLVARFKYTTASTFMTLLRKKFTVEEYFERYDNDETPIAIAESKGYLAPHIKRWLKEGGYPVTVAGREQMAKDDRAAWRS